MSTDISTGSPLLRMTLPQVDPYIRNQLSIAIRTKFCVGPCTFSNWLKTNQRPNIALHSQEDFHPFATTCLGSVSLGEQNKKQSKPLQENSISNSDVADELYWFQPKTTSQSVAFCFLDSNRLLDDTLTMLDPTLDRELVQTNRQISSQIHHLLLVQSLA